MRKEATLFALVLCIGSLSGKAIAQNIHPASSLKTPSRTNAPDNRADTTSPVNADAVGEVETLRRRVEEVEEQNRALGLLLTELKTRLESAKPPDVAGGAQLSNSETQAKTTPVAPVPSKQNDSGNVRWSDLLGEGNKLKLYGFIRLDLLFDSQQPNNPQSILFIKSPDPRTGNENGDFTMHPRLTRFGIDYSGPRIAKLDNAKLTGKLETDFQKWRNRVAPDHPHPPCVPAPGLERVLHPRRSDVGHGFAALPNRQQRYAPMECR